MTRQGILPATEERRLGHDDASLPDASAGWWLVPCGLSPARGAALSVLHDLSRQTQVLFFTHHPHLCDVARRRLGAGALQVHTLDQVVPA